MLRPRSVLRSAFKRSRAALTVRDIGHALEAADIAYAFGRTRSVARRAARLIAVCLPLSMVKLWSGIPR